MNRLLQVTLILLALAILPAMSHAQCIDSTDTDNDGIIACEDNCPDIYNPRQYDHDNDGIGNYCDPKESCCGTYTGGFPGNTTFSNAGHISLQSIITLIDHVYISKQPLECMANGDVNVDGLNNLTDITMLIDKVYINKKIVLGPCATW